MCLCEVNGLCSVFYFHCGLRRVIQRNLKFIACSSGAPKAPHGALREVPRDRAMPSRLPVSKAVWGVAGLLVGQRCSWGAGGFPGAPRVLKTGDVQRAAAPFCRV
jgi:hypothetical protein